MAAAALHLNRKVCARSIDAWNDDAGTDQKGMRKEKMMKRLNSICIPTRSGMTQQREAYKPS